MLFQKMSTLESCGAADSEKQRTLGLSYIDKILMLITKKIILGELFRMTITTYLPSRLR
jgi:hypothetical protein